MRLYGFIFQSMGTLLGLNFVLSKKATKIDEIFLKNMNFNSGDIEKYKKPQSKISAADLHLNGFSQE